jgi:hypothetical protein
MAVANRGFSFEGPVVQLFRCAGFGALHVYNGKSYIRGKLHRLATLKVRMQA